MILTCSIMVLQRVAGTPDDADFLEGTVAKVLAKGSRITGAQRGTLATQYAKRYSAGESIRKIAEDAGRSFGFVHGVLTEAGVALRGRGGATRGAKTTTPSRPSAAATKTPAKATIKTSPAPATKAAATKAAKAEKSTSKAPTKTSAAKKAPSKKAVSKKAVSKKAPGKKAPSKKR